MVPERWRDWLRWKFIEWTCGRDEAELMVLEQIRLAEERDAAAEGRPVDTDRIELALKIHLHWRDGRPLE